jgi:hypothetical protein
MKSINLSRPIGPKGRQFSEIVFKREPTIGDFADAGVSLREFATDGTPSIDVAIKLCAMLSDIPEEDIRGASSADWMGIVMGVSPFFVPSDEDEEPKAETSDSEEP